jgi:pyruvate dehydrogenase E1 component subunit alpha
MPKTPLLFSHHSEYLSILDENGNVDKELEPELPEEFLLKLYRYMLLGRRFDQRMLNLQRQGRMGTFPPLIGQEASQLGAAAALKASDWMVPAFREALAETWRGKSLENTILYYAGYDEGGNIEEGRNDLPLAIPVSSQTLHAVGIAMAMKYRGKSDVAMTFFGDGATSEGDFHEALNFAGVFQAPVIFICQNNQWAISTPLAQQTRSETIAQKATSYGFPGIQVDGNDILAVYSASVEAIERARSGEGPTLIECLTYRMSLHTTADDPTKYRDNEDVKAWESRDPISRFQTYLLNKGVLSNEKIQQYEEEIKAEIQSVVERSEELMNELGAPEDMFAHQYHELPPHLLSQREEMLGQWKLDQEEEKHG